MYAWQFTCNYMHIFMLTSLLYYWCRFSSPHNTRVSRSIEGKVTEDAHGDYTKKDISSIYDFCTALSWHKYVAGTLLLIYIHCLFIWVSSGYSFIIICKCSTTAVPITSSGVHRKPNQANEECNEEEKDIKMAQSGLIRWWYELQLPPAATPHSCPYVACSNKLLNWWWYYLRMVAIIEIWAESQPEVWWSGLQLIWSKD